MSQNKETPKVSQCSLCGSEQYGTGCTYAPKDSRGMPGNHCHKNGPGCMWCGSEQYGTGCTYAPKDSRGMHEHA